MVARDRGGAPCLVGDGAVRNVPEQAGVAPEQARAWNERIDEVFRTGRRIEVEEYLATAGTVGYFQSQCVPEYGPDGGVAHVPVVSRDPTERRRAEEAVRRSKERFREVLAGDDPRWVEEYGRVALTGTPAQFENYSPVLRRHYEVFAFRHPCSSASCSSTSPSAGGRRTRSPQIANSIHLLERVEPGSEQARRARAVIARRAAQLTRLVDDLLDVTRLSRNKIRLRRQRTELRELVHSTVEDHRSVFDANGIRLDTRLPEGPAHVDADPQRLAQIVGNLLQNAAKFTGPGGGTTVLLSVEAPGPRAAIRVRGTGAGMAPEMLARIFEPFVQADTTLDRSKGGLGLGLALVKGLVELQGGEVRTATARGSARRWSCGCRWLRRGSVRCRRQGAGPRADRPPRNLAGCGRVGGARARAPGRRAEATGGRTR